MTFFGESDNESSGSIRRREFFGHISSEEWLCCMELVTCLVSRLGGGSAKILN